MNLILYNDCVCCRAHGDAADVAVMVLLHMQWFLETPLDQIVGDLCPFHAEKLVGSDPIKRRLKAVK